MILVLIPVACYLTKLAAVVTFCVAVVIVEVATSYCKCVEDLLTDVCRACFACIGYCSVAYVCHKVIHYVICSRACRYVCVEYSLYLGDINVRYVLHCERVYEGVYRGRCGDSSVDLSHIHGGLTEGEGHSVDGIVIAEKHDLCLGVDLCDGEYCLCVLYVKLNEAVEVGLCGERDSVYYGKLYCVRSVFTEVIAYLCGIHLLYKLEVGAEAVYVREHKLNDVYIVCIYLVDSCLCDRLLYGLAGKVYVLYVVLAYDLCPIKLLCRLACKKLVCHYAVYRAVDNCVDSSCHFLYLCILKEVYRREELFECKLCEFVYRLSEIYVDEVCNVAHHLLYCEAVEAVLIISDSDKVCLCDLCGIDEVPLCHIESLFAEAKLFCEKLSIAQIVADRKEGGFIIGYVFAVECVFILIEEKVSEFDNECNELLGVVCEVFLKPCACACYEGIYVVCYVVYKSVVGLVECCLDIFASRVDHCSDLCLCLLDSIVYCNLDLFLEGFKLCLKDLELLLCLFVEVVCSYFKELCYIVYVCFECFEKLECVSCAFSIKLICVIDEPAEGFDSCSCVRGGLYVRICELLASYVLSVCCYPFVCRVDRLLCLVKVCVDLFDHACLYCLTVCVLIRLVVVFLDQLDGVLKCLLLCCPVGFVSVNNSVENIVVTGRCGMNTHTVTYLKQTVDLAHSSAGLGTGKPTNKCSLNCERAGGVRRINCVGHISQGTEDISCYSLKTLNGDLHSVNTINYSFFNCQVNCNRDLFFNIGTKDTGKFTSGISQIYITGRIYIPFYKR